MAQLHDGSVAAVGHSQAIDDITQLDASSCSATASAAYHSHAMEMSRLDASGRGGSCTADDGKGGHVVIDIDVDDDKGGHVVIDIDADDIPSCAVCMEPLEWVAVGPCGHRVVCSVCAARVRSAPYSDHRCCTCRTPCPTVLVTKAAADGELNYLLQGEAGGLQDGRVVEYWYCAAMSAYFDDERQYEAAAKAAAAAASLMLKQRPHGANGNDGERAQRYGAAQFLKYSFFAALFGMCIGFVFAVDAPGWGGRVGVVAGSAALTVAVGSVLWFLRKYGYFCGQQQQDSVATVVPQPL